MMVDLAVTRNLAVSSTKFPHKSVHKETWISPNGLTRNLIDHVMIDARHSRNVFDIRSYTGADLFMVKVKYRPRISIVNRTTGQSKLKYNIDKLQNMPGNSNR
jgi:hypothetical protein